MSAVLDLSPGDRITLGATHEVWIDGNKAWIKAELNAAVQEGENSQEAFVRVGKTLANNVINEIERQAAVMQEANAAQRR